MARFRPRPGPVQVLLVLLATVVILGPAPATALPIDGPIDDVIEEAKEKVKRTIERVKHTADGVTPDTGDAVSRALGGLPAGGGSVSADGEGHHRSRERERRSSGSTEPRADAGRGDVDEVARGGDRVQPSTPASQTVAGQLPVPAQGGANPPLGFTGLGLLFALLTSLSLGSAGLIMLSADLRRREGAVAGAG